jgi:hypothetical protein
MARELHSASTSGSPGSGAVALDQALLALEPELREMLARFHIPELDAAELISSSVIESVFKSQDPNDLALRARATLELRCRHYWLTRRFDAPRTVTGLQSDAVSTPPPADTQVSTTRSTRQTLRRLLSSLSPERSAT